MHVHNAYEVGVKEMRSWQCCVPWQWSCLTRVQRWDTVSCRGEHTARRPAGNIADLDSVCRVCAYCCTWSRWSAVDRPSPSSSLSTSGSAFTTSNYAVDAEHHQHHHQHHEQFIIHTYVWFQLTIIIIIIINSWFNAPPTARTMTHYTVAFKSAIPEYYYSKQSGTRTFSRNAWRLAWNASAWVLLAAGSMLGMRQQKTAP